MKKAAGTLNNFYLDTVKGRPSAEVFNGMLCVYSLLYRQMEEYFKDYELTPVKFNALMLLKHLGGDAGLSQNEICHHLIVSPSNITRLIDRLIIDGFVERTHQRKTEGSSSSRSLPRVPRSWINYSMVMGK